MASQLNSIPPGIRDPHRRIITNDKFQDQGTFLKYSCETEGQYTECVTSSIVSKFLLAKQYILTELLYSPCNRCAVTLKAGGSNPLHYHTVYQETFTCTTGTLGVQLGQRTVSLEPGESTTVPIGMIHNFFNDSVTEPVHFNIKLVPGHEGFEKCIYISYGLANDGLTYPDGTPKNLLHLCVLAQLGDLHLTGWSGSIANTFAKIGAWYARWSGVENELLKKYFW